MGGFSLSDTHDEPRNNDSLEMIEDKEETVPYYHHRC